MVDFPGHVTCQRLPIIGVMGSGTMTHADLAEPVGHLIATMGFHLLTGAGGGVMEAVSRAFCLVKERQGRCIGVARGQSQWVGSFGHDSRTFFPGQVNPWVEIPIMTHLPLSGSQGTDTLSRNHINVLSSDVLLALPGGHGTRSEVELCLEYGREVWLFLQDEAIAGQSRDDFLARGHDGLRIMDSLDELRDALQSRFPDRETSTTMDKPRVQLLSETLDQPADLDFIESKKVLVVGLAGSRDLVLAYAFSRMMKENQPQHIVFGVPRWSVHAHFSSITHRIQTLPEDSSPTKESLLDISVPRGDLQSPWFFALSRRPATMETLRDELTAQDFDVAIWLDLGGRVVSSAQSNVRSRRILMTQLLQELPCRVIQTVLSPGCDHHVHRDWLQEGLTRAAQAGRYLGWISLVPLLPTLKELESGFQKSSAMPCLVKALNHPPDDREEKVKTRAYLFDVKRLIF